MPQATHRKVIEYVADNRQAIKAIRELEALNQRLITTYGQQAPQAVKLLGGAIEKIKTQTIIDEKGIKRTIPVVNSLGQSFQTTSGQTKTFTETQRVMNNGTIKTTQSLSSMGKRTLTLGQNLANLAKRAALTIPIWLGLRTALMGTFRVIKDGIQNIAEFDRKLQKARRNLQGTPEEIEANFKTLRQEVTKLSLQSGKSVEEITDAFQRFATTGQDFETSMTGAVEATKLAITLFGNTEQNANALARAFRVLSDNIDDGRSKSEQLKEVTALLAELWKDQAFEIDEIAGALERFAPVASIANFTMEETIKVLAALQTAGIRGTRAGRLLSTAVLQLNKNFNKLQSTLGLNINPELTSTFERLQIVVEEIGKLQKVDELRATQALQELFGGVRGGQIPAALAAEFENFLNVLGQTGNIDKFQQEYEDMTKTTGVLINRIQNTNKEIGKAFVEGLVDAENVEEALEKILNNLERIRNKAKDAGTALRESFTGELAPILLPFKAVTKFRDLQTQLKESIANAVLGALSEEELTDLLNKLLRIQTFEIDVGLGEDTIAKAIQAIRQELLELSIAQTDEAKEQKDVEKDINDTIADRLSYVEIENHLKAELKAKGLSELEIEQAILQIREAHTDYLSKDLMIQRELVEHLKRIEQIELERARGRRLIDNQLQMLKLQGATTLQILQAQHALERMYNINQDRMSLLQNELSLQRAITEERLDQNKLSTDTIKLFEIAQKFGRGTAFDISRFLRGEVPLEAFETGGKFSHLMDILEKYFKSELQQRQAMEFFFRGRGTGIPIAERTAIEQFRPLSLETITLPEIATTIGDIKVEVKQALEKGQLSQAIVDEIINAIRNNNIVKRAIDEQIEAY